MKLWSELKRRNVLRMAALYLVTAWLILQVTEVLSGLIGVPDWVGPVVLAMLVIGLPIVLVISWFFEITESGITRDPGDVEATSAGGLTGRQFDFIIISMLAAALVVFATLTWWPETPADKSIAVMAFDNMSDHPEQEYFSEGISEEILGMLAQNPGLRVISRSSSFCFKDKPLDLPTIARHRDWISGAVPRPWQPGALFRRAPGRGTPRRGKSGLRRAVEAHTTSAAHA